MSNDKIRDHDTVVAAPEVETISDPLGDEPLADLGVMVLVIEDGRILLTKREDFEVWCLPGGSVEDEESLGESAMREVLEETGLEVALKRWVGIYSRPSLSLHSVAFLASIVGGTPRLQEGETVDLGFFAPDNLPMLLPWHHQPIRDGFDGDGGSVAWTFDLGKPFPGMSRSEIDATRDQSVLPRAEFFAKFLQRESKVKGETYKCDAVASSGRLDQAQSGHRLSDVRGHTLGG